MTARRHRYFLESCRYRDPDFSSACKVREREEKRERERERERVSECSVYKVFLWHASFFCNRIRSPPAQHGCWGRPRTSDNVRGGGPGAREAVFPPHTPVEEEAEREGERERERDTAGERTDASLYMK